MLTITELETQYKNAMEAGIVQCALDTYINVYLDCVRPFNTDFEENPLSEEMFEYE